MNVLSFDARQCQRIRGQMDAYLSNELLVETTGEVLRHLESCEACSAELDSRMRLREALRRAVEKQVPPERLREAVRTRLRQRQPRYFWQAPPTWALALASLALLVLIGSVGQQWLKLRRSRQMVAGVLALGVADHLHCAIKGHNYPDAAHPPDQLRQQLGQQYARLLPVVENHLPGFQVLEAHLCSVPGSPRQYVHFIARGLGTGTILSVILTRREGESLPRGRFLVAVTSGGVELYQAKLQDTSVAGFETNEYFGFVVSDLGQDDMLQLAASLAPGIRDAVDGTAGTEKAAAKGVLTASGLAGSFQKPETPFGDRL